MNMIEKLREIADAITRNDDPLKTQEHWALAARLLPRTPADPGAVAEAVGARDAGALDAIVSRLENPVPPAPAPDPGVAAGAYSHDDKAAALRAFKKRLKLARLSDESRLGGRYTSGGRHSNIDAIEPPEDFPRDIWAALVAEGRLVDTGQGFYALPA